MSLKPKPELELTKDNVHLEPLRKHLLALHNRSVAHVSLPLPPPPPGSVSEARRGSEARGREGDRRSGGACAAAARQQRMHERLTSGGGAHAQPASWMCSYGKVAFLSLIEHKESSHERPMGLVFERVMQAAAQGGGPYSASLRMIPFDFHRLPAPSFLGAAALASRPR